MDKNLPIYKALKILQPECTVVHEDCKILQQRRRWVKFYPNTKYHTSDEWHILVKYGFLLDESPYVY